MVIDLGYGAHPVTTVELSHRLRAVNLGVLVAGIEIDPERVSRAQPLAHEALVFVHGGFELAPGHLPDRFAARPLVIRAANVLRQYDESDVAPAWAMLTSRLADQGVLLDVTCDETGRRACWVEVTRHGPTSLSFAAGLKWLERPSALAERLPKALIHRNVPGERVHEFLSAWDQAWQHCAPVGTYGRRQRFMAAAQRLRADGWPLRDGPRRWRLGELTVAWEAVRPQSENLPREARGAHSRA